MFEEVAADAGWMLVGIFWITLALIMTWGVHLARASKRVKWTLFHPAYRLAHGLRASLKTRTGWVYSFQILHVSLFALRFCKILVWIYELQNMIQVFFACQLFTKIASFLHTVGFQAFQVTQRVFAVSNYLARDTLRPIFWVHARATGQMASSLPWMQVNFDLVSASATVVFPWFRLGH